MGGTFDDSVTVTGALHDALIELGGGFDRIDLAETGNRVFVRGVEELDAGTGNDLIVLLEPVQGMRLWLRTGNDTLSLADGQNVVEVNGAETVLGGAGDDAVTVYVPMRGLVSLGAGRDRGPCGLPAATPSALPPISRPSPAARAPTTSCSPAP